MHPVIVIGGPTASGKSGLALALAEKLGGTIINADSMQVYRGLPLLTAQPPAEDRARAPHLLYAALPPGESCSAAAWRDMALEAVDGVLAENRVPVITGGTGFYIRTLLSGISPIPDIPHAVREEAAALQKKHGNPGFHAELEKRDPEMARRLHPHNTQRLVRAWEVLAHTGKSLAAWQELPPVPPPAHLRFVVTTLMPPREELHARCDTRFDSMIKAGALEEAAAFRARILSGEVPADAPLAKALGYPELAAHLDGALTLPEAVQQAKQSTRHYAKRQATWFRHQIRADLTLSAPDAGAIRSFLSS